MPERVCVAAPSRLSEESDRHARTRSRSRRTGQQGVRDATNVDKVAAPRVNIPICCRKPVEKEDPRLVIYHHSQNRLYIHTRTYTPAQTYARTHTRALAQWKASPGKTKN